MGTTAVDVGQTGALASPPWVEVHFWTAAHRVYSEGLEISPGVLELSWTYTVDVRTQVDRSDVGLTLSTQLYARRYGVSHFRICHWRPGHRRPAKPVVATARSVITTDTYVRPDRWHKRN